MKILTLSSKAHPGVCAVFENFIGIIENSEHKFIEDITDDFKFDNYSLVILGAWTDIHEKILEKIKCKKAILITSSLGQIEQSNYIELNHLKIIFTWLEEMKIDKIFIGSKELYYIFKNSNILPFPYPLKV